MAAEKLTRESVVERALELANEEGVESLTIRRLAGRLGVTPMALYWHFKNKDEMVWALAEHLLSTLTADISPDDPWQVRLRGMVETLVAAMREHPSLPDFLATVEAKHDLDSFRRATEAALDALTSAGFSLSEGYYVSSYLLNGAIALVKYHPGCPAGMSEAEEAEARRLRRLHIESLPRDRFPRMIDYGATLAGPPDVDHYFAFGVDLLMAGVEAMARRRAGG
ncbi:putative transcriptional regulator, TetR family protein [Sphaerisporangium krabiense]|uniref:AcrR family transcriptional regulator n=1 Tax=Sphaerisporangium krabiense TaxID=763782 RepID=A0A7W8Z3V6_9ACTN|nr:TetR family transcriptional regulator [Sphaerisporangium krabiense]MBB5626969.1 AcrR family transcriptional regulator [Sphaerisporangium krabiense]GII66772.1 putative transcriptional regulator, TetR family protein [Sphaerisporangium krabiense]